MYTIGPLKEFNMVLFLRNKRFNVMLFLGWLYYLRWWRLPIEERACRKTDLLGGGDYYSRNSELPPDRRIYQYAVFNVPIGLVGRIGSRGDGRRSKNTPPCLSVARKKLIFNQYIVFKMLTRGNLEDMRTFYKIYFGRNLVILNKKKP